MRVPALALSLLLVGCAGDEATLTIDLSGLQSERRSADVTLTGVDIEVESLSGAVVATRVGGDAVEAVVEAPREAGLEISVLAYVEPLPEDAELADEVPRFWGVVEHSVEKKKEIVPVPVVEAGLLYVTVDALDGDVPSDLVLTGLAPRPVPVFGNSVGLPLDAEKIAQRALPTGAYTLQIDTAEDLEIPGELVPEVVAGEVTDVTAYLIPPGTKCSAGRPDEVWETDPPCLTVGGTVEDLEGSGLTLTDDLGEVLSIDADGPFTFSNGRLAGDTYSIVISGQPTQPTQTCSAINANGTVSATSSTTVRCTTATYPLEADVTGLEGQGMKLTSGASVIAVPVNGLYTVRSDLSEGETFDLTISQQPTSPVQICEVDLPTTVMDTDGVTAGVNCRSYLTVGGNLAGLVGSGLEISNGTETIALSADGPFTFPTELLTGDAYDVTVVTQPSTPQQTCAVTNGSGTITEDITTVGITCTTDTFSLLLEVTGLDGTATVMSGADAVDVTGEGTFTIDDTLVEGDSVSLSLSSVPDEPVHDCVLDLPSSTMGTADITATLDCTRSYTVAGSVSGLKGSGLVLENDGESLPISADGSFTFPTRVDADAAYDVVVTAQPTVPAQTCTVAGGTGNATAPIDAVVTCVTDTYPLEVSVSGLSGTLVLQNNGADDLAFTSDGTQAFSSDLEDQEPYAVTILSEPGNQSCVVTDGSGTADGAPSPVTVECFDEYDVYVDIIGLQDTIDVSLNGGGTTAFSADGLQLLGGPLTAEDAYAVTTTQPGNGDACTVFDGSGDGTDAVNGQVTATIVCVDAPAPEVSTWNSWRRAAALGTPCDGTEAGGYDACVHLSERLSLTLTGVSSCSDVLGVGDTMGAFVWSCDDGTGTAVLSSSGLHPDAGVSDLLDFAAADWADHQLEIDLAQGTVLTPAEPWYTNPVVEVNSTTTLSSSGQVAVANGNTVAAITIAADNVTLAVEPGFALAPSSGDGAQINGDFAWVEGAINAASGWVGIDTGATHVTVRHGVVSGGSTAIRLNGAHKVYMVDTYAGDATTDGISVTASQPGATWVHLDRVVAAHNGADGIQVGGSDWLITDSIVADNNIYGLSTVVTNATDRPTRITLDGLRSFQNSGDGLYVSQADSLVIANSLSVNNFLAGLNAQSSSGLLVIGSHFGETGDTAVLLDVVTRFGTLHHVAGLNAPLGLEVATNSDTFLFDTVAFKDGDAASIEILDADTITWDGDLIVVDSSDCSVPSNGQAGIDDTCAITTGSAVLSATGSGSVVDLVGPTTDAANTDADGSGRAIYSSSLDVGTFETGVRVWGKLGDAGDPGVQGACRSGQCQVRDWALLVGSDLRDVATVPSTGDDTFVHRWAAASVGSQGGCDAAFPGSTYNGQGGTCDVTALRHAVELSGDGVGNDDGLCESDEDCLFLAHVGAWQGHGAPTLAADLTTGTVNGVRLFTR